MIINSTNVVGIVIPSGVSPTLFVQDLGLQTYAVVLNNKSNKLFAWIDYQSSLFESLFAFYKVWLVPFVALEWQICY